MVHADWLNMPNPQHRLTCYFKSKHRTSFCMT